MNFDLPPERSSQIKVIGVGGGGSNAVNHMYKKGIKDVNFVVCNTDAQALHNSPVAVKLQLGDVLTEGRGAGSKSEIGREAAQESIDRIKEVLSSNTNMVFITAGMGGGTGTGAAPVIASTAKEMGILTVAIVTIPFRFEGPERINQAIEGINALKDHVDSLLVINNEKLREIYGNLTVSKSFEKADDVLAIAAKGIAEIITVHGYINVDFADVQTVMSNSGVAIMGSAAASGEERARKAIEEALTSPLLNNNDIEGARSVLLNITSGAQEITMDEVSEITDYVVSATSRDTTLIWGIGSEESLGEDISVTIIATGFRMNSIPEVYVGRKQTHKVPLRDRGSDLVDGHSNVVPAQGSLSFGVKDREDSEEYILMEQSEEIDPEAHEKKLADRVRSLRETHEKLRERGYLSSSGDDEIEELENVPAYVRKKVPIDQQKHSQETEVSRYRLTDKKEEGGEGPKLSPDNPHLHDNVD
ncbi:MAG: cell division protein FtsZ [Bacteroidetes bacterium]|nr:MAG: cell division protein FtsZ [Bacteroidota bacterium]RLD92121.1 MAG: cell division protein FtsZ [Bacteroidota bacterium]